MGNGASYPFSGAGSQIPGCPITRHVQILRRTTKICQYFTMKQQGWSSSMPEGSPKYEDESGTLQWGKMPSWGTQFYIDFSWQIWICDLKIEQDVFHYSNTCHMSHRKQSHHWLALINLQFSLGGGILPHSTLLLPHFTVIVYVCCKQEAAYLNIARRHTPKDYVRPALSTFFCFLPFFHGGCSTWNTILPSSK